MRGEVAPHEAPAAPALEQMARAGSPAAGDGETAGPSYYIEVSRGARVQLFAALGFFGVEAAANGDHAPRALPSRRPMPKLCYRVLGVEGPIIQPHQARRQDIGVTAARKTSTTSRSREENGAQRRRPKVSRGRMRRTHRQG
jgi:hypothetical protein